MLRKARGFALLMLWPLALGAAGCDCDNSNGPPNEDGGPPPVCCVNSEGVEMCIPVPVCSAPFRCDDLEEPTTENGCQFIAPLDPGQLAMHLDIASTADGTVLLSGHSAGRNPDPRYGDLLVGSVSGGEVTWSIVDGVPAGTPTVQNGILPDESGWRGGVSEAGDNVGEWNAIAFSPDGATVGISYYDRTNGALKYASSTDDGATWAIQTVHDAGDSGQFTSLAFLADGRPAISFLMLTPSEAVANAPTSSVQVAIANSATPAAAADWVVTMVGTATPVACTEALCGGDLVCRADGACAAESAAPATDCTYVDDEGANQPGCDSGATCVSDSSGGNFSCQTLSEGVVIEDVPVVNGLYTSLRATGTGLALVWHDRVRRTLRGSAYTTANTTWRAPFNIDGFDAVGSGDSGYNADLFVNDAGNWYVAYVDGVSEELRLAEVNGTTLGNASPTIVRATVDDGVRGTNPPHIVGADADVAVTSTGEVRIVYHDATSLEALVATRPAASTDWTLQGDGVEAPLDSENQTGFWTCQALEGDTSHLATWWVNNGEATDGTRVFTIP